MISKRFELPSWTFEGSNRSAFAVHQSWMQKMGRSSGVLLVKVPPFSVLALNRDLLHSGSARTGASTARKSAAEVVRYHFHLMKERCSLPDGILYLLELKPRFLQPLSANKEDLSAVMNAVCRESLALDEASTETRAAPRT